ncbi:MAG: transposase [Frankiales bacterium]|nr:transposase [Frankiales bacterium]
MPQVVQPDRAGVDRKTARRYVEAGRAGALVRDGGEGQFTDALIGAVVLAVRPARGTWHSQPFELSRGRNRPL